MKKVIITDQAPAAIGTYSQAVAAGPYLFISGQIPLDPDTMTMVTGDMAAHVHCVFRNIAAIMKAAGGSLADIVKLNLYLVDLSHFAVVNAVMAEHFSQPFPARALVQVAALPREAIFEADAIALLPVSA